MNKISKIYIINLIFILYKSTTTNYKKFIVKNIELK